MDLPAWLEPLADAVRRAEGLGDLPAGLIPEDGAGRASAVLIALGEVDRGPSVLLIQRAATLRRHAGQAASLNCGCATFDGRNLSCVIS